IAHRLALNEKTVWARLNELKTTQRRGVETRPRDGTNGEEEKQQAPAPPEERELLQVLLADPKLVPEAAAAVAPGDIGHPGLRQLVEGLYQLQAAGQTPDLDLLRLQIENPRLIAFALKQQEIGRLCMEDKRDWLRRIVAYFRERQVLPEKQELQNQL